MSIGKAEEYGPAEVIVVVWGVYGDAIGGVIDSCLTCEWLRLCEWYVA